ncbi:uncharacterized protein BX663DRAFT_204139 [Cokeromyces recurvatus]|uniref:uncharacterized protein n=1 Tax=Cokeromyces recurvatus TaxID=90255 RepID=UPI00221FACBA|nr:uncharacterized protein BX663DRAFT_204139 [Cokeromyces recurvatus]KAI7906754.1 hypothetical protein BX663DRAFT_204139 [Cokeromyces recurvatus]
MIKFSNPLIGNTLSLLLRIRQCYSSISIVFFAHKFSLLNQIGYGAFERDFIQFWKVIKSRVY